MRTYLIIIMLLILPALCTGKPAQISFGTGCEIQTPQMDTVPINSNLNLHAHVINGTNGRPLNSSDVTCVIHLYNNLDSHIGIVYSNYTTFEEKYDFSFKINNNFTTPKFYTYILQCNNSIVGCFTSGTIEATPNGYSLTTEKSILFFMFAVFVFLIFLLCLYWTIVLPYQDTKNDEGEVISINDLKYLKIFLSVMSYIILWMFFGMMNGIFSNYMYEIGIGNYFDWAYNIMLAFIWPCIVVGITFLIINYLNSKKLQKTLNGDWFK